MKHYDLIVVGGGFTGVCAAIAAAREKLSVLLIERTNCLGGAPANNLVNPFMAYWTWKDDEKFYLSRGIFLEIAEELKNCGALGENESTFDEEWLKLILNRMVLKEGIDLLFHSYLMDANVTDGNVTSITVANKSGNQTFTADFFIDATGDGDLAVLSGCPYHLGRPEDHLCQPMTLCFRLANVDIEKFEKARPMMNPLYQEWQAAGKIKNPREDILIFGTMIDGVLHFNSTRIVKRNPVDAFDITAAEIEAREQVFELYHFLKENIDGFQNAKLISTAMQIGTRESRMIEGNYLLTSEDLVACTKFEDAIAEGNYDIDIHNPEGSGTSHYYFEEGTYYTIPYRCLCPKGTNNLWVAGRCISSTHEAQASYRIMPICATLGQAAGTAAAVAKQTGTDANTLDVKKVQAHLPLHSLEK